MANRWMDERERQWRNRSWQRPAERDYDAFDYAREERSFHQPRSDYDPYAEYREDWRAEPRGRPEWQGRYYGGVSPAMRQGEYQLDEEAYRRQPRFRREDYTHYGEHRAEPRYGPQDDERDSVAYRAGDFLGRAGRRVAEFFQADHEEGQGSFRGMGPKGYQRSDARISEDVHDRLTDDHWLDARAITVSVASGEITLAGTVDSRESKRRAERITEDVPGVRHVQNNLRVSEVTTEQHTAENESWEPDIGANPLHQRRKGSSPN